MPGDVETLLRGPSAYAVARQAMDAMEKHGVWPTALNFELWTYFVAALEERLADSTEEVNRLREHLEQVRRDATTDGLTNLANRKAFDDELDRACAEAEANGETLTLAVIDIDHFKTFNDTWGHQTGDQ